MTIMFCSFQKHPLILRLYGDAHVVYPKSLKWGELYSAFSSHVGARQIFELNLSLVQSSCGYAVPLFDFKSERHTLKKWAENQGGEGIEAYWEQKNQMSLNGKITGI